MQDNTPNDEFRNELRGRISGKYASAGQTEVKNGSNTKWNFGLSLKVLNNNHLRSFNNKKFFKLRSRNVKETYLFTQEELKQKLATINLFEKFDADGSGALDSEELKTLYNENGIMVTEDEIKKLYGDENVKFTLEMFESITNQKEKLKAYRSTLSRLRERLASDAMKENLRGYIPPTFDTMMLDFGNRV